METRTRACLALAACALLSACVAASALHSDDSAALVGHPLFTTRDAFVIDRDPTFLQPRVTAALDFPDPAVRRPAGVADCLPASIAEYQANQHHWEEHDRLACDGDKLIPLPAGAALQIDTLDWSWDFENGTQYYITARLLDAGLTGHEIHLRSNYFVEPRDGKPWQLDPNYFTAQAPAKP